MGEDGFSMIVLMVVVTTILTPPLLRYIYHLRKKEDEKLQQAFNKDISIEKPFPQSGGEAEVSPEIKE